MKTKIIFILLFIISKTIVCQIQSFVVINWTNLSFESGFVKYFCCGSYSNFVVCEAIDEYSAKERRQRGYVMSVYIENSSGSPFFDLNNPTREVTTNKNEKVRISLITTRYLQIIGVNICTDPNTLEKTGAIKQFIVYNFTNNVENLNRIDYLSGNSTYYPNIQCPDNSVPANTIKTFPIEAYLYNVTKLHQGKEIVGHNIPTSSLIYPIFYYYQNCIFSRSPLGSHPLNPQQMMVGVEISNSGDDGVIIQY